MPAKGNAFVHVNQPVFKNVRYMHVDIAGPDILRLYVSPIGFTVEEKFLALLLEPNLSNLRDSRF